MRRAAWVRGRRGAVVGATAAVVCLGGALAAATTDGSDTSGYVAVGAAGAKADPGRNVAPTDDVQLVPLHTGGASPRGGGKGVGGTPDANAAETPGSSDGTGDPGIVTGDGMTQTPGGAGKTSTPGKSGPTEPAATSPGSPEPGTETPADPAALTVGTPDRSPGDHRWCENVTVAFRNTGGTPIRSGTVTFGTHIIGALGIDWATIESTEKLPAPIDPGKKKEQTWTVCVDAWRVPLGMHVETRDVSVDWK